MKTKLTTAIATLALFAGIVAIVSSEDNPHGKLAWDCVDCHSTASWNELTKEMKFSHKETGFRLEGAHVSVSCRSCHGELIFNHVGTACADCHADHHEGQLGFDCQNCHVTRNWQPQTDLLQQHQERGFPLTGVHAVADCEACHQNSSRNEFVGTPTECASCHQSDLASATDPDHSSAAFGADCQRCHHAAFGSWNRTTYEHPGTFPLTGAHAAAACGECHAGTFAGTPADCYSCHSNDYQGSSDPNHVAANFPTDCNTCHTTVAWEPAAFDHDLTAFPLQGRHFGVACQSCHPTQYTGTPTDCYSCHQSEFESAGDPDHVASQFPTDCQTCHSVNGWEPANVNHDLTAFPLTGRHVSVDCNSCHIDKYTGTATDCYSCHQANFAAAVDPNHVSSQFPTDCQTCHTTISWSPAQIDHNLTAFPLTGAHTMADCIACHSTQHTGTPTNCYSCHQSEYAGTTAPDHAASQFATTCQDCHNTTAWQPATFDHNQTAFPLTGQHVSLQCLACHATQYANTPTDCYACHQTDYDGTTNPNHAAANFPIACASCHSTNGWTPANWDHDAQFFPIYSGAHRGKWNDCSECHINPSDYTTFECILCHEHNKNDMDNKHQGEQGYQYLSSACFSCHPRGRS